MRSSYTRSKDRGSSSSRGNKFMDENLPLLSKNTQKQYCSFKSKVKITKQISQEKNLTGTLTSLVSYQAFNPQKSNDTAEQQRIRYSKFNSHLQHQPGQRDHSSKENTQRNSKENKPVRQPLKDLSNIVRHPTNSSQEKAISQQTLVAQKEFESLKISSPIKDYSSNYLIKEEYKTIFSICPQAFTMEFFSSLIDQQIDVTRCLKKHKISNNIRQKMIDWMIEVIVFVFNKPNISSLFKSINLMDIYIKKCPIVLQDNNIHLIGICCLIICNHFEQCHEISLAQFYHDVAHKSFDKKQLIQMEIEILKTIDHNLNFSTAADFNNQYIFFIKRSQKFTTQFIADLSELSYFYILQSYFFEELLTYEPRIISLAALFVAIEALINCTKENTIIDTTVSSIQKALLGEFKEGMDSQMSSLAFCIKNIKIISVNFQQLNPKLTNYKSKFDKFILN